MSLTEPFPFTLVVVPTYNERENLPLLLERLMQFPETIHVLVVDDGSPDGTASLAREAMAVHPGRIHLMERPGKLGLGTAYVTGFRWALERTYERVVEMDADFSHDPAYLPALIAATSSHDLAIGSRYVSGVNVVNWPMSRLLLSWFANRYVRLVTGMPVHDCTAGFKCFRTSALRRLDLGRIAADGYSFQIEVNYKLWKLGASLIEVPIVFTDRVAGRSKMSGSIVREALFLILRLRWSRP